LNLAKGYCGNEKNIYLDQVIYVSATPADFELDISKKSVEAVTTRNIENNKTPLSNAEKLAIKSVKAEFERLQKTIFKEFKLGLLYGSMKGQEKDDTMSQFANGKINLLVATSVIEVGIDIPNATVIAIEGAERFGLAQLHQLRGRVGRGAHKSFCLLFPSNNDSNLERLEMFSKTSNGFDLAEIDLRQRGFGSLLGEQQSGYSFKYSQFLSFDILKQGRLAAEFYLNNHRLENSKKLNDLVSPLVSQVHLE
jgi:ATP-dependent DNA helicase RecG